ncbi:MAG: single-stranded-DNA-specific exonuclease RecJ [Chloroflexota bacterium]
MPALIKDWQIPPRLPAEAYEALHAYPPILRQILYNRGYADAEAARDYLEGQPPAGTQPSDLSGMPAAVDRIAYAIERREAIVIYGDYDTDGVTATVLLVQALKALGGNVRGYIPNRFDEGYGLNKEALTALAEAGVELVITVDCGIRSIPEAEHAQRAGLDLIITDHHHPTEVLPPAHAIINPKQPGDTYPDKDLAGVGLAYKLACALLERFRPPAADLQAELLLDLVALGTVADMAPLVGENRALVRSGLNAIRRPQRQGLRSLIGVSGLKPERIQASDIGFALGPRLNAAGRLDSALAAYELLSTRDVQVAGGLAQKLEIQNRERQSITREMQAQAEQIALAGDPDALLLFAAHPDFNPGVVGLVASRLTEAYYRPAIVAQLGEQFTRGSCRSIREFHITDALDECTELLEHHGGHAAAAGFTVRSENLPELIARLQAIAARQLGGMALRPSLAADLDLPLKDLRPELLEWLERLQPTGYGNPQAYFVSRGVRVDNARSVGRDSSHLKLTVSDGGIYFDAIAFRQGHWLGQLPTRVDLLYAFETNEFNGRTSLQLNVRDIKAS